MDGKVNEGVIPVNGAFHLGVVVRNCRASMAAFSRIFGISRWEFQTLSEANFIDPLVYGEPRRQRFNSAVAVAGPVRFELVQSLEDDQTVYADFVSERGYGLQHLFYTIVDVEEFARVNQSLQNAGIGYAQNAVISDTVDYYYCDTFRVLGGNAEILVVKGPNPAGGPPEIVDFGPEVIALPGRPVIDGLYRIGVVTAGPADEAQLAYHKVFGLDGWSEVVMSGRRSRVAAQGAMAVELVEAEGAPLLAERAKSGGPSLTHITVAIIDPQAEAETVAWFAAQGLPLVERLTPSDGSYAVLRFDGSQVLDGVDVEIVVALDKAGAARRLQLAQI
ncbi:VOC family protein [Novosphingobium sp. PASSN1]|uniref:VOC family protein n=1 Tax=Novosphingobium sp. PASSN1 TaxID=2015561 RepID=UPI0025FCF0DD|nr:VOC family protein [Novosphingobium sp. PASSN1]